VLLVSAKSCKTYLLSVVAIWILYWFSHCGMLAVHCCGLHLQTLHDQINAAQPTQPFQNNCGNISNSAALDRTGIHCHCIHSHDMSCHTQLLSIFIFILFYGGHIVFWLAGSVSPPVLATGFRSSCYGSSSEPKGEYLMVLLLKSCFMGTYMSIRPQPYCSPMWSIPIMSVPSWVLLVYARWLIR
jgi:hypothetical protein